jgi:hypothetical protein
MRISPERRVVAIGLLVTAAFSIAWSFAAEPSNVAPAALSAGKMTVADAGQDAYLRHSNVLSQDQLKQVADGKQFFERRPPAVRG